jgi:hypothetical protein
MKRPTTAELKTTFLRGATQSFLSSLLSQTIIPQTSSSMDRSKPHLAINVKRMTRLLPNNRVAPNMRHLKELPKIDIHCLGSELRSQQSRTNPISTGRTPFPFKPPPSSTHKLSSHKNPTKNVTVILGNLKRLSTLFGFQGYGY